MSLSSRVRKIKQSPYTSWDLVGLLFIYVIAVVLAGLDQFIESGFDLSVLRTSEWWFSLFQTVAVNGLVLFGTIWYGLSVIFKADTKLQEKQTEIDKLVDEKVDPVTFDPFMTEYNTKRKIRAFKREKRKELGKLEEKASDKDRHIYHKGTDEQKMKNKYSRRKKELLTKMTDKWIQDNIFEITTEYNYISPQFVTVGYNQKRSEENQYVESSGSKMFRDLSPKFAITFIYLLAVNSVALRVLETDDPKTAALRFIFMMAPIIAQVIMGRMYVSRYKDEKLLVDFRTRKEIIGLYLASLKGNQQKEVVESGRTD